MANGKRTSDTFPDAYLSCGGQRWTDIVTFGEFKKIASEEDARDNIAKVTASMTKCMHKDPRRRFLYAFTIENTRMRLSFCDRLQIVVSEPFNFITDHEPLVRFFLSLMYATPEEVGLDPTMAPLEDGQYYDVTVHAGEDRVRTYRTLEILRDSVPKTLRYKGTRVWKAIRLEDGKEVGEPVALKDVWIDYKRTPEGTLLEKVCKAERPVEYHADVGDVFVTVECHGDVFLGEGPHRVLDCTRHFDRRGPLPKNPVKSRDELGKSTVGSAQSAPSNSTRERLVHYRIVFKDIGKSLREETSFPKIFQALAQTALALEAMHDTSWVHRDVSPGNILLKADGGVLLADFEFAKEMGPDDECRLGTAGFVALEIDTSRYKFRDMLEVIAKSKMNIFYYIQYNPLHDLESLWWIAVFFLVCKEIVDGSATDETFFASPEQRIYAGELFQRVSLRDDVMTSPDRFSLESQVLPASLIPISQKLDKLRLALRRCYALAEQDVETIDRSCAQGLHKQFYDGFRDIASAEENRSLKVRPYSPFPLKRMFPQHFQQKDGSPVLEEFSSRSNKRCHSDLEDGSESTNLDNRKWRYLPRKAKARQLS